MAQVDTGGGSGKKEEKAGGGGKSRTAFLTKYAPKTETPGLGSGSSPTFSTSTGVAAWDSLAEARNNPAELPRVAEAVEPEGMQGYTPVEMEDGTYVPYGRLRSDQLKPRTEGEKARDVNIDAFADREPTRTRALTRKEYRALGEHERAAVDFNTLLVKAREKDLNTDYSDMSDAERREYNKLSESMFGEDGGSEQLAPETLGLLQQIDYRPSDASLDDFLGLKVAITEDDLKALNVADVPKLKGPLDGGDSLTDTMERSKEDPLRSLQLGLTAKTTDLAEKLKKSKDWMASTSFASLAELDRNQILGAVGGVENVRTNRAGFGNSAKPEVDQMFQDAFDELARAGNEGIRDEVLGLVQSMVGDKGLQDFMAYADTRSRTAALRGIKMGYEKGETYIKPQEFRRMLNLNQQPGGQ